MNYDYSKLLKEYRKIKGFSQYQLAKQVGETQAAIAQYENGHKIDNTVLLLLTNDIEWLRLIYNIK